MPGATTSNKSGKRRGAADPAAGGWSTPEILRVAALAVFVIVLLRTAWICDDAFITYRVIDNFVHGYGLRWNVVERVQVFTHPLWLMLLTPIYFVTREIFVTALAMCIALSAAAAGLIAFRLAPRAATGTLAVALLFSSKAFVDYSTCGLENALTHLLLVLFAWRLASGPDRPREQAWVALIAGLGALNRLDTLLLFLPGLAWALRSRRAAEWWRPLLAGFAPLAGWFAFATLYYGFPFPNTAWAKLGTGIGLATQLSQGLAYFVNSLAWDPVTLLAIAAALALAVVARRGAVLALAGGTVLYLGYVVAIGGDFMSGRFFAAPFVLAAAIIALSDPLRGERAAHVAAGAVVLAGLATPHGNLLSGPRYGLGRTDMVDAHGIADERGYYFRVSGLFNGRSGPIRDHAVDDARSARRCRAPVSVQGAIGFYGFTAGPQVHVVDHHALGDPFLARLPAVRRDPMYAQWYEELTGRAAPIPLRVGHYLRTMPEGYLAHVLGDRTAIADARMREDLERLTLITRGPVFSPARLAEVVRWNLGSGKVHADPARFAEYVQPRWDEIIRARPDASVGYAYRGSARVRRGETEAGVADLRAALERCPEDAPSLVNLGVALIDLGREAEARPYFDRAIGVDPLLATAFYYRGYVALGERQTDGALADFRRAIELDPGMTEAQRAAASILARAGQLPAAAAVLEDAVLWEPLSAPAWAELGQVYAAMGDTVRARRAQARGEELSR